MKTRVGRHCAKMSSNDAVENPSGQIIFETRQQRRNAGTDQAVNVVQRHRVEAKVRLQSANALPITLAADRMFSCVSPTSFGFDVVPEVRIIIASRGGPLSRPVGRKTARVCLIAPDQRKSAARHQRERG